MSSHPRLHSRHQMSRPVRTRRQPPDGADDPAADAIDRLLQQFLDDLMQGLSPNGPLDPFTPDGDTDGQGA